MYKTKIDYLNITVEEGGNFFSSVYTKFHLIGVLSYVESLIKLGVPLKGYICIAPHAETGYAIDEQYLERYNLYLVRISIMPYKIPTFTDTIKPYYQFLLNKKNKNKFYLVKAMSVDYESVKVYLENNHINKKLKLVAIDEGIGTYMPMSYWANINKLARGNDKKRKFAFLKTSLSKLIEWPFKPLEKRYIFKKEKNNKLIKNKKIINEYFDFYSNQYNKNFNIENEDEIKQFADNNNALAIYFSQPIESYELFSAKDEQIMIKQLEQELLKKGIILFIKPHPRESKDKFFNWNVLILDYNLPSELLVLLLRPKCVFGFTSTALATASVFFDIKAYSVISLLEKDINTSSQLIDGVRYYKHFLSDYIYFPKNYSEIC